MAIDVVGVCHGEIGFESFTRYAQKFNGRIPETVFFEILDSDPFQSFSGVEMRGLHDFLGHVGRTLNGANFVSIDGLFSDASSSTMLSEWAEADDILSDTASALLAGTPLASMVRTTDALALCEEVDRKREYLMSEQVGYFACSAEIEEAVVIVGSTHAPRVSRIISDSQNIDTTITLATFDSHVDHLYESVRPVEGAETNLEAYIATYALAEAVLRVALQFGPSRIPEFAGPSENCDEKLAQELYEKLAICGRSDGKLSDFDVLNLFASILAS